MNPHGAFTRARRPLKPRAVCRRVAETLLPSLRAFGVPVGRVASLRSTALSDRLRLFVVIQTRSVGLVRDVRVVLALVVFLSGAFGRLVLPFLRPLTATLTRPQSVALDSPRWLRSDAMDDQVIQLAQQLLKSGFDRFSERERRVITAIASRHHVTRNVNEALSERHTWRERLSDQVARFGGSWTFITIFIGVLIAWVFVNTIALPGYLQTFDPYPYIFLNLILSMVAALQAPIILMSQSRQAMRDRLAASLDYEVNLKAEIEIMALHDKLDQFRLGHLEELIIDLQGRVNSATELLKRIAV